MATAISLVTGLLLWVSASRGRTAIEGLGATLSFLPTLLLGVFVVMPWLVRTMVEKRFRGFCFVVVREQEGGDRGARR
jgi:flagellar biosynthesis protein FliQ